MRKPRLLTLALAVLLAFTCVGIPVSTLAQAPQYTGDLAPYTIKWYLMGSYQPDVKLVQDAINEITVPAINAKLELYFIDAGSYDEKMRVSLASGDEIDLCFTSNFANDYLSNVAKNAFQPISMDTLERLAPRMMEAIPAVAWEASTVGGQQYGMQIERVMANTPGILLMKEYVDKYQFDTASVKSIADFAPLYEQIAANDPGISPIDINAGSGIYAYSMNLHGMEIISGSNPGGILIGEENPKVVNLFETQEMRTFLHMLRDWYNKGFIRKDAATVTDVTAEFAAHKIASRLATSNPDTIANQANVFNVQPEDLVMVELTPPYMSTNTVLGGLNAIARTSKDPERCIMFYDMMYDREDTRIVNLINYGIEGVHYNKVDENTVERIKGAGYYFGMGWQLGSLFNCYKESVTQPNWIPAGPDKMNSAVASAILGFNFDPEPVKVELAHCRSVFEEYIPALFTGSVEVDEYLDAFIDKLRTAGSEKIVQEMNNQLDAWRAGK